MVAWGLGWPTHHESAYSRSIQPLPGRQALRALDGPPVDDALADVAGFCWWRTIRPHDLPEVKHTCLNRAALSLFMGCLPRGRRVPRSVRTGGPPRWASAVLGTLQSLVCHFLVSYVDPGIPTDGKSMGNNARPEPASGTLYLRPWLLSST